MPDQKPPTDIIMYICPRASICGNFYASPEFRPDRTSDLARRQQRRSEMGTKETHSRLECPTCRARGIFVDRVPVIVTTIMPLEEALVNVKTKPGIRSEIMHPGDPQMPVV